MRKLEYNKITSFCEELAWMVHSGVNVGDSLTLLAEEEQDMTWKECLMNMAAQADGGSTLSEVVNNVESFPIYVQGIIGVGEATGRLEEALKALAKYYYEKEQMGRRIRSALLYPLILLLLILVVMVVLLTQVLPIFESVFSSLGSESEGIAGFLFDLGAWLNSILPFLCVLLGLVLLFVLLFSVNIVFREKVICLLKRYVGDKGIMRKMNDAALAQAIAMGFSSGLPMEETMDLAAQVLSDVPSVQKRCFLCREELLKGTSVAESLKIAEVLPVSMCRLLSLGMQGGNGDSVMVEIANKLSEDADIAVGNTVAKIEPTLVLVTSVLVGAILLAVMLPLMNIMEMIG